MAGPRARIDEKPAVRPRKYSQRHSAGFTVVVSLLVLVTFSLVLLWVFQQRRATEQRQVKQALQMRLERAVESEILRLSRSASGALKTGPVGAARVEQAIDNVLARSFDQMLALEQRQATLRRFLRQAKNVTQRRRIHQQLRQAGKELEIANLWVLMLEDRRQTARRLERSDAGKPPPKTPDASPSNTSLPRLPDWLSALE
jgi:hypothetical protein